MNSALISQSNLTNWFNNALSNGHTPSSGSTGHAWARPSQKYMNHKDGHVDPQADDKEYLSINIGGGLMRVFERSNDGVKTSNWVELP